MCLCPGYKTQEEREVTFGSAKGEPERCFEHLRSFSAHPACLPAVTLPPALGGEASPLRGSPPPAPDSPTHNPAVGPRVHLAGQEQSMAPQVVLHGPRQGFLKTKASRSVLPPRPPLTTTNAALRYCCPSSGRGRAPAKTLGASRANVRKKSWGNGLPRARRSFFLHFTKTHNAIALAPPQTVVPASLISSAKVTRYFYEPKYQNREKYSTPRAESQNTNSKMAQSALHIHGFSTPRFDQPHTLLVESIDTPSNKANFQHLPKLKTIYPTFSRKLSYIRYPTREKITMVVSCSTVCNSKRLEII